MRGPVLGSPGCRANRCFWLVSTTRRTSSAEKPQNWGSWRRASRGTKPSADRQGAQAWVKVKRGNSRQPEQSLGLGGGGGGVTGAHLCDLLAQIGKLRPGKQDLPKVTLCPPRLPGEKEPPRSRLAGLPRKAGLRRGPGRKLLSSPRQSWEEEDRLAGSPTPVVAEQPTLRALGTGSGQ